MLFNLKLNKKYYNISLIIFAINLIWVFSAYAQLETRWWDAQELGKLSVERDLKFSRAGKNWYVDGVNGDDKNGDGTLMAPWKTIGKAFDHYSGRPAPGDAVIIKAGIYRERLDIRCRGSLENRVFIGPYGDGEVILDGSEEIKDWTLYKRNIYKGTCLRQPVAVVTNDAPLFPEFSLDTLGESRWLYNAKEKAIYLNLGGKNPLACDIGIISDDEYEAGLFLDNASYVALYGLTVRFFGGKGISVLGDYNRIEKCDVKFNGKGGIAIWQYGKTISTGNQVVKNHIYHNMIRNWPRGRYKQGLWSAGGIASGPNTEFIGNISHNNGGEGLLSSGKSGGTIFRDNIVYDNWSVNIYIDGQPDCLIENNLIFSHEPNPGDLYNNGDKSPQDGKNLRRLRAEGIMTADESSPATFQNARIINNIIIGCRRGITHYSKGQGSGLKNVLAAHNTIILPNAKGPGEDFVGINIPYNNGSNSNVVFANNIVYAMHPSTFLLCVDAPIIAQHSDIRGVIFKNNLWFHQANPNPFHIGSKWLNIYNKDFNKWQKECMDNNHCSKELYADPEFIGGVDYSMKVLNLNKDSPAIDAGTPIKGLIGDYNGSPRDNKPDIGAVEVLAHD